MTMDWLGQAALLTTSLVSVTAPFSLSFKPGTVNISHSDTGLLLFLSLGYSFIINRPFIKLSLITPLNIVSKSS